MHLWPSQKARHIETLRARLAIIKHLNQAVNPLLRYCDFSEESLQEVETLGKMVMEMKGGLFYDTKVRGPSSLCCLMFLMDVVLPHYELEREGTQWGRISWL